MCYDVMVRERRGGRTKTGEPEFPLRKSPVRTAALLAANRANAQKCTGPRTPQGRARVALNVLKHGAYAVNLPENSCGRAIGGARPNAAGSVARLLPPLGSAGGAR